jgi:uncharacterized protein (DUF983 family)
LVSSSAISTQSAIFHQLCPRCRSGRIFARSIYLGFPRMNEHCPVCDLKFEREPGYFLGAMYISYGIGVIVLALLCLLLWRLTDWGLSSVIVGACVLFLPFALPVTLFSRVLWIYFDRAVDPEKP